MQETEDVKLLINERYEIFERLIRPYWTILEPMYISEIDEEFETLDTDYKIDGICTYQGEKKTLALRTQVYSSDDDANPAFRKNWRTFTIRRQRLCNDGRWNNNIGYSVIKKHIDNNEPYPEISIQSYILDDVLLGSGCALTKNIIEYITKTGALSPTRFMTRRGRLTEFYYIGWDLIDMIKEIEVIA